MNDNLKESYDIVHNLARSLMYNQDSQLYEFTEEQYMELLQVECNLGRLLNG